jgi:ureidoacrylate peracid hydrolase
MNGIERLHKEAAAVIIVDVQNDFCDPDGACAAMGNDVTAAMDMVERLDVFLNEARAAGVPLIWIQTENDHSTDSPVWLARRSNPVLQEASSRVCRAGSWGAQFYEVAPQPGETIVRKSRYSAFADTNLDLVLRATGRQSVLLTGVSTNVCVESTLREALFHDYHVTLVEDCCASYEQELHDSTVRNVAKYFGYVHTSSDVVAQWAGQPVSV